MGREERPPKATGNLEQLKCGATCAAALLGSSGAASVLSLLLPWWRWVGRYEDDFWGLEPQQEERITLLGACSGGSTEPSSETCLAVGSITTFMIVAASMSGAGAGLCAAIAKKYHWIVGLLVGALLAAGSAAVQALAIWMAIQLRHAGLNQEGVYLALTAVCLDAAAATLALWSSNKATPPAGTMMMPDPAAFDSRLVRARAAREAARALHESIVSRQAVRVAAAEAEASPHEGELVEPEAREGEGISDQESPDLLEEDTKPLSRDVLQRVLDMSTREGRSIPVPLLEAAFQEVDHDFSGSITQQELEDALRDCGLDPSSEAMERIFAEIDTNQSGKVDVVEFVDFFKMAEELYEFEMRMANRAAFFHAACQCGFCVNVIVLAGLVTMLSRTTDTESAGFEMLAQGVQIMLTSFFILFVCVIGLPMVRLTLGPSIEAWVDIIVFFIREKQRRYRTKQERAAAERAEAEELERKAAALEAGLSPSPSGSPASGASPRSPTAAVSPTSDSGLRAIAWGEQSSIAQSVMTPNSPTSMMSPWSMAAFVPGDGEEEEEEGIEQKPGTYMVLHDGMAVRSGVSLGSQKIRTLKRGQQVRIIEVFEYHRQARVRGRLEPAKDSKSKLREWVSLRDMEDDYWWVRRLGPLQEEPAWMKQARYRRQKQLSNISQSTEKNKKRLAPVLSPEDAAGAPPYEPDMYQEAWMWQQEVPIPGTFNGTMQVRDIKKYCGQREKPPEEKEVQGGLATDRGEWRLGFAER